MSSSVFYNATSELATVRNVFSVGGVATDPTTVSLAVTDPTGTTTTYTYAAAEITKNATGDYQKDISCASTVAGVWEAVWTGTGAAVDTAVVTWTTVDPNLERLYVTPEVFKDRAGINDALDDDEVYAVCVAASAWVNEYCGRYFWRGTATRYYPPCDLYKLVTHDLVSVTSLKTDSGGDGTYETTWSSSDYQLLPRNTVMAGGDARPYTSIKAVGAYTFPLHFSRVNTRSDRIEIVGVFGWPSVPQNVRQAAKTLATDFFKLGQAPFGVAGFGDFGPIRARPNPYAEALLQPYRRYDQPDEVE